MSVLTLQQRFNNLEISMQDPVTHESFIDPVTVDCCLNTFNRSTIDQLVKKICPLCHKAITNVKPNLVVRIQNLASILPVVSQRIADGPLSVLPFPGASTEFSLARRWREWDDAQNPSVIRKMELHGRTIGAFIERVSIFGDNNDNVSVVMECSPYCDKPYCNNPEAFGIYFSRLGLACVDYTKYSCVISQPHEFDWLLDFITRNNTFRREIDQTWTTRLLQAKKWRCVEQELAPKKPEENVPSPYTPAQAPAEDAPPTYEAANPAPQPAPASENATPVAASSAPTVRSVVSHGIAEQAPEAMAKNPTPATPVLNRAHPPEGQVGKPAQLAANFQPKPPAEPHVNTASVQPNYVVRTANAPKPAVTEVDG